MARRATWPTWKIIAVMAGAFVIALALWPLGGLADKQSPASAGTIFTLGSILRMFSMLGMGVVLIMGGWLAWRYYRSIPAWRRRRKLPPPRR
jgi:hypothetical protein